VNGVSYHTSSGLKERNALERPRDRSLLILGNLDIMTSGKVG
jgi:hypothetical protein